MDSLSRSRGNPHKGLPFSLFSLSPFTPTIRSDQSPTSHRNNILCRNRSKRCARILRRQRPTLTTARNDPSRRFQTSLNDESSRQRRPRGTSGSGSCSSRSASPCSSRRSTSRRSRPRCPTVSPKTCWGVDRAARLTLARAGAKTVVNDFQSEEYAWIGSAYTLSSTALIPLSESLSLDSTASR